MHNISRRNFLKWSAAGAAGAAVVGFLPRRLIAAPAFHSRFEQVCDRVWLGPDYWANPMEDWIVRGGRIECVSPDANRSVHVLTRQLSARAGSVKMTVRVGKLAGDSGSAGFVVGVHDDLNDYRGNLFFGEGVPAAVTVGGTLVLGSEKSKLTEKTDLTDVTLTFEATCKGQSAAMTLTATDTKTGKKLGKVSASAPAGKLVGNLALGHNAVGHGAGAASGRRGGRGRKPGGRFWFRDWTIEGDKVDARAGQAFGPILWAMHTLDHRGGGQGHVLKMTAQMPPIGAGDSQTVRLETRDGETWKQIGEAKIDPEARTATFRIPNWQAGKDVPYRLAYTQKLKKADDRESHWAGTVRKDPAGARPLKVAKFTCQYYRGYPYVPLVANVAKTDPDVMIFSGDQIYEPNGGYGIIREPAGLAILNYLRKWYLFGWAFGDLLRDRPAICIPDDHDVFHGNLWGEGGKKMTGGSTSTSGGYREPASMVNVVHRTNTAHLPDPYDPTPGLQGITGYYCDLVYGRTSFGIVADRQYKSGPEHVDTGGGRADWVKGPGFDIAGLDKPGLKFLGDGQMKFLDHWVADWRGADMKLLVSQTVWSNVATRHGNYKNILQADLDSGGWPQRARDAALRVVRKGFPLHVNGDQHLPTLTQYGIDEARDGCWSFCTPAITTIYQRWWTPDVQKFPHTDRPAHKLPNTGQFVDGLGNLIYVYAVGNPEGTGQGTRDRYQWAQSRAAGFGIVTVDGEARTYKVDCYRFLADLSKPDTQTQYPGWPHTVKQRDNYGRKVVGHLSEVSVPGVKNAVLEVRDQKSGEMVYAVRVKGNKARPWVFADGTYTVRLGDPDTGKWETFKGQKIVAKA